MRKPTFFISSTVYDFKDLRSAIKYYLEQQGCRVLSSEYPDFKVDLDKDSYQACIDAIGAADYFILLIGGRVGGWYDKEGKISITQQEYREAYRLHKLGKIKILSFVRSEIWELRENRSELKKYLARTELSDAQRREIQNHPSKQCEDAEFIIRLINEVARNSEMKQALEKGGAFPSGNWIFQFSSFREMIDTIQSQIFVDNPVEEATLRHLLAIELRENLKALLWKFKDRVVGPEVCILNFYAEHEVPRSVISDGPFFVNGSRWAHLSTWSIHLMGVRLSDRIVDHCLRSSVFLEYDRQAGRVRGTPALAALQLLSEEIRRFRVSNTSETLAVVYEYSRKQGYSRDAPIPVPPEKLLALLHLFDRWINIIKICELMVIFLEGGEFAPPLLRPRSPIPGMNLELDGETVSDAQLETYLGKVKSKS